SVNGNDNDGYTITLNGVAGPDMTIANDAQIKRWQQNAVHVTTEAQYFSESGLNIYFLGDAFESGSYWQITTNNKNIINWPSSNGQFVALPPNSITIGQLMPNVDLNPTLQNQFYRVEIHQGSKDKNGNATIPTFKWSRDNASVSSSVSAINSNNSGS